VLDYVAHLAPSTHAVLCYENVETVRQVLVSYLKGSEESNEAVRILSSSRESFGDFLQSVKLHAPFLEEQIDCIEMNKFSSKTGGIDYETALSLLKSRFDETKRLGFNGLRVLILANDYLEYTTPEGVLKFEKQLGQNFPFAMTVICGYDLAEAGGGWNQVLLDLLKVHRAHVFKGVAGSDEDIVH
jgi:hypothetical protein